ncbi:MAG: hypothetical protein KDA81_02035, partial [Planctomycetaceae bacterium]|nr:hypothetical protein [Planctomycetaceae bacterium]
MSLRRFLKRLRSRLQRRHAEVPRAPNRLRVMRLEERRLLDASFGINVAGILDLSGFDNGGMAGGDQLSLQSVSDGTSHGFEFTLANGFWDQTALTNPDVSGRSMLSVDLHTLTIYNNVGGNDQSPTVTGISINASGQALQSIANSGDFAVSHLSVVDGGSITLNAGSVDLDTISATGESLTISDIDDLELNQVSLTTTLNVSAAGEIKDADNSSLNVSGNAQFSGTDIVLGDHAGDVTNFGSLSFSATGDVDITEDSHSELVGTNSATNLTLSTNGALTDGGSTTQILGLADLQGDSITLGDTVGDSFTAGNLHFVATGNVDLHEADDMDLSGDSSGAIVHLSADGAITTSVGSHVTSDVIHVDSDGDVLLSALGPDAATLGTLSANSGSGTITLESGTFFVDGSTSISGTIDLGTDAVLGGNGTVGDVVLTDGTVSPGNSPGILNTGNFSLGAASTLSIELFGTNAGTPEFDQLNVTGSVTLAGTLDVSLGGGFAPAANDVFEIIHNDDTEAVSGTFNGLAEGSVFVAGGEAFVVSYVGGTDSNDVTLTSARHQYDFDSATYSIDEDVAGGKLTVVVNRSGNTSIASSVDIVLTSGTATAGTDFASGPITVNFAAGETSRSFDVSINNDAVVEADETFGLSFSNFSDGGSAGTTVATSTATIANDDTTTVTLTPLNATRTENADGGGTTNFTFQVALTNAVQGGFSIGYTTSDGTATLADGDYTDNDGTLNFAGSASESRTITVSVTNDDIVENHETFSVQLANTVGNVAFGVDTADFTISGGPVTGTIQNDDTATLSISNISATESNLNQTLQATVTLNKAVQGGFDVAYALNPGSAESTDVSVAGALLSFSGTAGEQHTIDVTIVGDTIVEDNETFDVTLGDVTNTSSVQDASITTGAVSSGAINNDDKATLSINDVTVNEAAGTATFTISSTNASESALGVSVGLSHGTTSAGDVVLNSTSATIAGDQTSTSTTVTVAITDDLRVEGTETYSLTISAATYNGTADASRAAIGDATGAGTVIDNDNATISFNAAGSSISENETTTTVAATLTVNATGNSGAAGLDRTISVDVNHTGGTGSGVDPEADFSYTDTTLTFSSADGNGTSFSKTVTIAAHEDLLDDDAETIELSLQNLNDGTDTGSGGQASIGATRLHTVTINDDDTSSSAVFDLVSGGGAVVVQVSSTDPTVLEFYVGGVLQSARSLTGLNDLTINGTGNFEDITLDYSAGSFSTNVAIFGGDGRDTLTIIGATGSGSVTFDGQGDADTVFLIGKVGGSDFDVTYVGPTDRESGTVVIDGAFTLNYIDIENNSLNISGINNLTLNLTGGDANVFAGQLDAVTTEFFGDSFTTTNFTSPADSLTINFDSSDYVVSIVDLADDFDPTNGVDINGDVNGGDVVLIIDELGGLSGKSVGIDLGGGTDSVTFQNANQSLSGLNIAAETITATSAALAVSGATTLDAGASGTILLDNGSHDFSGDVTIVDAGSAEIHDANSITFADITVQTNLTVHTGSAVDFSAAASVGGSLNVDTTVYGTGGAITDSTGSVTAGGTTVLDAGNSDITLDDVSNDFVGQVSASGSNITIVDINSVSLNTISAATLQVTSGGAVTDVAGADIAVVGNATFHVASISLGDNATDSTDFGNLTVTSTNAMSISEDSSMLLNAITGSTVTLTSETGEIADHNGVAVNISAGSAVLRAVTGIGDGDVLETTLGSLAFHNTISGNVQLVNSQTMTIAVIGGLTASANAGGNITLCVTSGNLLLNSPLSAVGNTIRLQATAGRVAQTSGSAEITSALLGVRASGDIDLAATVNKVSTTFAAASTSAGVIRFSNGDGTGFDVGTVAAVDCFAGATGVTSNLGDVKIISHGSLQLTEDVVLSDGSLLLDVSGNLIQLAGATISAHGLGLLVIGNTTLNDAGNDVGTLAVDNEGTTTYRDADTLTIGEVTADGVTVTGVSSVNGTFESTVVTGDLTVAEAILAFGPSNVILTTLDGDVLLNNVVTVQNNSITVNSSDAINGSGRLTAINIDLNSGTGIGNNTALELSGSSISADSAAGDIDINNAVAATFGSLTTGIGTITVDNAAAATFTTASTTSGGIDLETTSGSLTVGTITAGNAQDVIIKSAAAIIDDNNAATKVTGSNLDAAAGGAITLQTDVDSMDVSTSAAGDVLIHETNAVTLTSITTADGAVTVSAGGTLTATNVDTSTADDDSNDISLTTVAGDILIGLITAGSQNDVALTSAGAINDFSANPDAVTDISAGDIDLNAAAGIGNTADVDLTATGIFADTTTGNVSLNNDSATDVTVGSLTTGGGTITFSQSGGGSVGFGVVSGTNAEICLAVGDIELTNAMTANDVRLQADMGLVTQTGGSVSATNLGVRAATGISLGQASNNVTTFAAATTSGDVLFHEANGFQVGSVTAGSCFAATTGVTTPGSGAITLEAISGSMTISRDVSTDGGDIDLDAEVSIVSALPAVGDLHISTSGSGSITVNAGRSVEFNANVLQKAVITTEDGSVTINGGGLVAAATVDTDGIRLDHARIQTATGSINLTGTGGTDTGGNNDGIAARFSTIQSNSGHITLIGNGGAGGISQGIEFETVSVSTGGDTIMQGTGGATGDRNSGMDFDNVTTVQATGSGTVTLTGSGGDSGQDSYGVVIQDGGGVAVEDGSLLITGDGGADGDFNYGVHMLNGSVAFSSGSGSVTVIGTGGDSGDVNVGVVVDGAGIGSTSGLLTVTGTGGANGVNNAIGVWVTNDGAILSLDTADVVVTGVAAGTGIFNFGVFVIGQQSIIGTKDGHLTVTGTGGGSAAIGSDSNFGVLVSQGGEISSAGLGTIDVDGDGTAGQTGTGVVILGSGSTITSVSAAIDVEGTSTSHAGIQVTAGGSITSGTGSINVSGTAGTGGTAGINIFDNGSVSSTGAASSATLTLTGIANGAQDGVRIGESGVSSGSVSSVDASISINGTAGTADAVSLNTASTITSTGAATIDIDGTGSVLLEDGTAIRAVTGSLIDISATENITISEITSTGGEVRVDSTSGLILDADSGTGTDITATSAVLQAATGIGGSGTAGAIETVVSNAAFDNSVSGLVHLSNTGDLTLSNVNGVGTSANTNADVKLVVNGHFVLDQSLTAGSGNILLAVSGNVSQNSGDHLTAAGLALMVDGTTVLQDSGNDVSVLAAANGGETLFTDATGLTIGTVTVDSMTFAGITTTSDDVRLTTGTDLVIDDDVNLVGGNLLLDVAGNVTQQINDDITAAGLALVVDGTTTLTNSGNDITQLAANNGGATRVTTVNDLSVSSLTVDANAVSGVTTADSDVRLTVGGDLSIENTVDVGGAGLLLDVGGSADQVAAIVGTSLLLDVDGTTVFDHSDNDFAAISAVNDAATEYRDRSALEVGRVTVDGSSLSGIATTNDNVTLCATTITLATGVAIGSGTLRLSATAGSVTQTSGSVTARELGVRSSAGISLTSAGNDVDEFAANGGSGSIVLVDGDGYAIDEVTADGCFASTVTGLTTAADFESCVSTGNISITSALNVGGTVRLEAITGSVIQTANGTINSANLGVLAAGDIDLNEAAGGNNVDGIFSAVSGSIGVIEFADNGGYTIGSIAAGSCFSGSAGATTSDGAIVLTSNTGAIVNDDGVSANGTSSILIETTTSGSVVLNGLTTADGDSVIVNSAGSINGGGLITANSVSLMAASGIGDSVEINLSASAISADSTSNAIDVNNSLSTAVTVSSVSTDSGDISFDQSGGGDITFSAVHATTSGSVRLNNAAGSVTATSVTTDAGTIDITATSGGVDATSVVTGSGRISIAADGGTITARTVTAGTASAGDGDVELTTTSSGDVLVDSVTAAGDSIRVTSVGTVDEIGLFSDAAADLLAEVISISAVNGIGTTEQLELDADDLAATTTSGDIRLQDTADGVTVSNAGGIAGLSITAGSAGDHLTLLSNGTIVVHEMIANSGDGNVLLSADDTAGNITVNNSVSSNGGHVTLMAQNAIALNSGVAVTTSGQGTIHVNAAAAAGIGGAFTMAAGALLSTGSGDIHVDADDDITVGRISTGGNVALISHTASIVDADPLGDTTVDIVASGLQLKAAVGVGSNANHLETAVLTIAGRASDGGLFVSEANAVTVNSVGASTNKVSDDGTTTSVTDAPISDLATTGSGSIVLTIQAGSITLNDGAFGSGGTDGAAVTASGTGHILLSAGGQGSDVAVNAEVTSGGGHVTVHADDDIETNAAVATQGTGTILLSAGNNQTDGGSNDGLRMQAGSVVSADSDIMLRAGHESDVVLQQVLTSGNVSVFAEGSIRDGNAAANNVTAADLILVADSNHDQQGIIGGPDGAVGNSTNINAVDTEVSTLAASAADGIYLQNSGGELTIDEVSVTVQQVGANAAVTAVTDSQSDLTTTDAGPVKVVNTSGDIIVNEGDADHTGVSAASMGHILLDALNGAIVLNANVESGTGHVTLQAQTSLSIDSDVEIRTAGSGTIVADAVTGGLMMATSAVFATTDGDIHLQADGDVEVGRIASTTGNVAITSVSQSILDADSDNTTVDVTAHGLRLNAQIRIGTFANALETKIGTVSGRATSGGIHVVETDGIEVNDVAVSTVRVAFDSGTNPVVDTVQSDLRTTGGNGDIRLTTLAGTITLHDGTSPGSGESVVADGSGNVTLLAQGTGSSVTSHADIRTDSGDITIIAAQDVMVSTDADITTGAGGDILVDAAADVSLGDAVDLSTDTDGNISLLSGSSVSFGNDANAATTGGGDILIDAAADVS